MGKHVLGDSYWVPNVLFFFTYIVQYRDEAR